MGIFQIYTPKMLDERAKILFQEERERKVLNGWFLAREYAAAATESDKECDPELRAAQELTAIVDNLPLDLSDQAVFAGTQRDAFAASYALINPAFQVETFRGYCDPLEVYDYATATEDLPQTRIDALKKKVSQSAYVRRLSDVYQKNSEYTDEVVFFFEAVTGHVIPDFRSLVSEGIETVCSRVQKKIDSGMLDQKHENNLKAMVKSLQCAVKLAHRYAELAEKKAEKDPSFSLMAETLHHVPEKGARNLYEAIQSFLLLWQIMCLEQAPNPFAFSVGNVDRIFYPYMKKDGISREEAAGLFKHFLVFFNVGERSWAISQNLLIGGRDCAGNDLTNEMSYAILDAFFEMNFPQPILSVKLHQNTPEALFRALGRFFFTPGCLTPSLFNDDSLFQTLRENGVEEADLPDYAVAGCQEPLIMGKDNGNTTNTWFNLGKILELTLSGGVSTITGKGIGPQKTEIAQHFPENASQLLKNVREIFYQNAEYFADLMAKAGNGASEAVSLLPVPFLSTAMGGLTTAVDTRDATEQGTRYNGSGCLIHGLSVVSDSFIAIDTLLRERPEDADNLLKALQCNFEGYEELRDFLHRCPKYGNNDPAADAEAVLVAEKISEIVSTRKNYLGNSYRPDWSSPSTHLLYGYWVGATPDGRGAREMLNYGIDPLSGDAGSGLGFRTLSAMKLPYQKMSGGCASHYGIDPRYFPSEEIEEKGVQFYRRVVSPLFFNQMQSGRAPFYLYVNVTTPETLRKLLENPKKYAPSGVYIMRIHGTFVNFLDLSPAIQEDIIRRLDLQSTSLA